MRLGFLVPLLLVPHLASAFDIPADMGPPRTYQCPRVETPPVIDGLLEDDTWHHAPWTEAFTDIEGPLQPAPSHETVAAMCWDDENFYFAFRLEEPQLQASFTERDSYIYQQDNDIEIFIDPDGDNHLYCELELNALNTVWDLLIVKPYRDGGPAVHAWDIAGLQTAVHLDGTLNDASDTDRGWTVEVAIPWDVLGQVAGRAAPPADGDVWRVNFSRVQWDFEAIPAGGYAKALDPGTGRPLPEHNWVWSPQGMIAMHMPENWGEVQFVSGEPGRNPDPGEHRSIAQGRKLMHLYYQQRQWREDHDSYASDPAALGLQLEGLELTAGTDFFRATLKTPLGTLTVDQTGRLVRDPLHPRGD